MVLFVKNSFSLRRWFIHFRMMLGTIPLANSHVTTGATTAVGEPMGISSNLAPRRTSHTELSTNVRTKSGSHTYSACRSSQNAGTASIRSTKLLLYVKCLGQCIRGPGLMRSMDENHWIPTELMCKLDWQTSVHSHRLAFTMDLVGWSDWIWWSLNMFFSSLLWICCVLS